LTVINKLDNATVLFEPVQDSASPALHGLAFLIIRPAIFIQLLRHIFRRQSELLLSRIGAVFVKEYSV